jgi:hypothetical protein
LIVKEKLTVIVGHIVENKNNNYNNNHKSELQQAKASQKDIFKEFRAATMMPTVFVKSKKS